MRRQDQADIFEILEKKNVNHAICVAHVFLRKQKEIIDHEYYFLVHKKDLVKNRLLSLGFHACEITEKVWLKKFRLADKDQFEDRKSNYKLVKNNEDGKIYELKTISFKQN